MKAKCYICGKKVNPKTANAIYAQNGLRYYCKNRDCHERFIEDAGESPCNMEEGV